MQTTSLLNKEYLATVRNTLLGKDTLWIYQALDTSKKRIKQSLGTMENSVSKLNNRVQITNEISVLAFICFGVILPISVGRLSGDEWTFNFGLIFRYFSIKWFNL